jgi:hypothetical protein
MNYRSKKYFSRNKANSGKKKGSSTNAGYDEQNEKTSKESKQNPAPSKSQDQPNSNANAEQDDTAGPNNSGDRIDEN